MHKTKKQRIICAILTVLWVISILPQSGLTTFVQTYASAKESEEIVETDDTEEAEIMTIADLARLDGTPFAGSAMETNPDATTESSSEDENEDVATVADVATRANAKGAPRKAASSSEESTEAKKATWDFTIHYVGEDNYTDVTKTDDFSLKYQYEFYTEGADIEAGKVVIRINADILYNETTGEYISPSDIGVPEFSKDEDENYTCVNSEGTYNDEDGDGTIDGSNYIATSPFNYYYEYDETDGHIKNIVFVNYRSIPAGTNVAIQVLYDNLKAFDFNDMDTWEIQADVEVNDDTYSPDPLTGLLDTSVDLTSVTKNSYKDEKSKVSYTPGLYTVEQVKKYTAAADVPSTYLNSDGTLNTTDYVYTVFQVKIEGTCNQRFNLTMQDIFPGDFANCGEIVGISKGENHNTAATKDEDGNWDLGYYHVTDNDLSAITKKADDIYDDETFSAECFVVAAYKIANIPEAYKSTGTDANGNSYESYNLLNSVNVTIHPEDGTDSVKSSASTSDTADTNGNSIATWEPYFWDYENDKGGDGFTNTSKSCSAGELSGWFEGFENFTPTGDEGYDAGISFTVSGTVQTYEKTHTGLKKSEGYEEYTGGYVHTIFADDVLCATEYNGTTVSDPVELTGNDYYIDGGKINMRDIGIDVWNDETCAPTEDSDVDRKWYIYGLTANGEWELIQTEDFNTISWDSSELNKASVAIKNTTEKGNRYYRIKVEHNTIDYKVEVSMKLNYKMLKSDNSKFSTYLSNWNSKTNETEKEAYKVVLDNYSAFTAYYQSTDGKTTECLVTADSGETLPTKITDDENTKTENFTYKDTLGNTLNLIRKKASCTLQPVQQTSSMIKRVESKNNSNNARVNITYTIGAYDGYEVFSQDVKEIVEDSSKTTQTSPNYRTKVAFYDLLPYKVHYDGSVEPTIARITNKDYNFPYTYTNSAWKEDSVTLVATNITTDYNGTGRELVEFVIEYTGDDPSVYNNSCWYTAYGISFGAYVTWSNYEIAKNEENIAAYINKADDEAARSLLGTDYTDDAVDCVTNGDLDSIYEPFGEDIDGDKDSDPALYAYAKGLTNIAISAKSGIEKKVRSDDDVAGSFSDTATVAYGGTYTYQISISNANQSTTNSDGSTLHNIIAFDKLEEGIAERYEAEQSSNTSVFSGFKQSDGTYLDADKIPRWKGTIQEINLSSVSYDSENGVAVYYTTDDDGDEVTFPTLTASTDASGNTKTIFEATDTGKHYRLYFEEDPTNEGTYDLVLREVTLNTVTNADGTTTTTVEKQGIEKTYTGTWHKATISDKKVNFKKISDDTNDTDDTVVTAFAVDFGSYELASMEQLVFDVKMLAPDGTTNYDNAYAYNNPAYYSTIKSTDTVASLDGNAIKVGIGSEDTLTIAKQFTGNTLEQIDSYKSLLNTQFTYTITDSDGTAFADRRYYLWEDSGITVPSGYTQYDPSANTSEKITEKSYITIKHGNELHYYTIVNYGTVYTTDAKGQLTLKANQAATFDVINASRLTVKETLTDNWTLLNAKDGTTDQVANSRVDSDNKIDDNHPEYIFKNVYNSIIYLQKTVTGVPSDVDLTNQTFTFNITSSTDGVDLPYKILKSASISSSNLIESGTSKATKNNDGTYTYTITFNKAYTAAIIFEDMLGKDITIKESLSESDKKDWECLTEEEQTETLSTDGKKIVTFENVYLHKYLDITKSITNQDAEETRSRGVTFSFKIYKYDATKTDNKGTQLTAADLKKVKLLTSDGYSTGNYLDIDSEGNVISTPTTNCEISITDDGIITANCAGRIIRVEYLDADTKYIVEEVSNETNKDNYSAVNSDTIDVTIAKLPSGTDVDFTNDYLMRGLSVTKSLAAETVDNTKEFTLYLLDANGIAVSGKMYTLDDGSTGTTGTDGEIVLKNGQTATFAELGKVGTKYQICELIDGTYKPLTLAYKSTDTRTDPATITLGSDGGTNLSYEVVNGDENYLVFSKEYDGAENLPDEAKSNLTSIPVTFYMTITNGNTISYDDPVTNSEGLAKEIKEYLTNAITLSGDGTLVYDEDGSHTNNTTAGTFYFGLKEDNSNVIYFQTTSAQNIIINASTLKTLFGIDSDEDIQYTISEEVPDTLQNYSVTIDSTVYGVSVSKAADFKGDSGDEQAITVTNTVNYIASSQVLYKYEYGTNMSGSITFLVEEKSGSRYVKKSGIRCMAIDENGDPITDIIESDDNGYITINASGKKKFMLLLDIEAGKSISIDPNDTSADYHITEVASKTDSGCGYLVGYGKSTDWSADAIANDTTIIEAMDYDTGDEFPTDSTNADIFINANGTEEVIIEKDMENSVNSGTFTFKVSEVLGTDEVAGANLSYSVYTIDGDTPVTDANGNALKGVTGSDGTFTLNPGQYVKIKFPKYATWKVYEKATTGYNLIHIEAANFDTLDKSNVMNEDSDSDGLYDGDLPKEVAEQEGGSNKTSAYGSTVLNNNLSYGEWDNGDPTKVGYSSVYSAILAYNSTSQDWSFYWTDKTQDEFASYFDGSDENKKPEDSNASYSKNTETEYKDALTINGEDTFSITEIDKLAGLKSADSTTLKIPDTVKVTVPYSLLTTESQELYRSLTGKTEKDCTSAYVDVSVPVVAVDNNAFDYRGKQNAEITSLTLGANLEYIGGDGNWHGAFYGLANVKSFTIPEKNNIMKVDSYAFYALGRDVTSLATTDVNIPLGKNCKYVGASAFYQAFKSVKNVGSVDIKVGGYVGSQAFQEAFGSTTTFGGNVSIDVTGAVESSAFKSSFGYGVSDSGVTGNVTINVTGDVGSEAFNRFMVDIEEVGGSVSITVGGNMPNSTNTNDPTSKAFYQAFRDTATFGEDNGEDNGEYNGGDIIIKVDGAVGKNAFQQSFGHYKYATSNSGIVICNSVSISVGGNVDSSAFNESFSSDFRVAKGIGISVGGTVGDDAFYQCFVEIDSSDGAVTLTLGNDTTSIGKRAFYSSFRDISKFQDGSYVDVSNMPDDNVTIENNAFTDGGNQSSKLPNNVTLYVSKTKYNALKTNSSSYLGWNFSKIDYWGSDTSPITTTTSSTSTTTTTSTKNATAENNASGTSTASLQVLTTIRKENGDGLFESAGGVLV